MAKTEILLIISIIVFVAFYFIAESVQSIIGLPEIFYRFSSLFRVFSLITLVLIVIFALLVLKKRILKS